jgi:ABC-type uncharacterized transport system substrate-binding protein
MSSDCGTVAAVTRTSTGLHFTWAGFMCVGLKSEKVADLPVQQSMKVALTLNLKTAKTLGITFAKALEKRAE